MKQTEGRGFYRIAPVMDASASIPIALFEKIEEQIQACPFVINELKCPLYYSPIVRRLIL